MSLIDRVLQIAEQYQMFSPGLRVGVAVSGGPDSMFLLHTLRELAPRWNLHLAVIHIDHGIRGEASRADAALVEQTAASFGLRFYLKEAKLTEIDDNLEQAARRARLAFYTELIEAKVLQKIATGHTLSDQAETVLYRLLRGSGLAGLSGILPVTTEGLVRPLLSLERAEILASLRERGLEWREDETNRDPGFARNRLRHEILPLLREHFNPALDQTLAHLATLARDEEDFWLNHILPGAALQPPTGPVWKLRTSDLTSIHPALARHLVRRGIEKIKGNLRSIDFAHVETILEMARASEGSNRVQLPSLDVYRSFDWLRIAPASYDSNRERHFNVPVSIPGSIVLLETESSISFELIECKPESASYANLTNELDWERLTFSLSPDAAGEGSANPEPLELRNWRPGDHYQRIGQSKEEKLKLLFQQARIPLWERRHWPVLTCAGRIVWTRQFGPAADVAARADTRRVLRVREQLSPEY